MASKRPEATASDFWRASRGFSVVWTAHLGRRHGLFEALSQAHGPLAPAALARRAWLDAGAVGLWCQSAAALGLVFESRGRFALPRPLVPLLVDEQSPAFLGGHLDYLALRSLDFEAFDEFFRDGVRSARPQRHLTEAFAAATKWDHTAFLEVLLPRARGLQEALAGGAEVLDVGSGTGAFDLRVARAFPRARFLGIDPDGAAVQGARAAAAKAGLDARVSFAPGRAESIGHRERFDLLYLGEVLCADDQTAPILARCHAALKGRGHLVVAEGLIDETRPKGAGGNALVLAMQLEFALQPARFFTKRELVREVKRAGFQNVKLVNAGGGFHFLWARKAPVKAGRSRTTGTGARARRWRPPRQARQG